MRFTRSTLFAALALAASALGTNVQATTITPTSYTFDQSTSCGSWCYHDPSLTKLTDGIIGKAGWAANVGKEWVGWVSKQQINIDFSFASVSAIGAVAIGSTQDHLGDVALPSFSVSAFESGHWVQKGTLINAPSNANDNNPYSTAAHSFYTLSSLGILSDKVRLSVYANGPWSFVDEVRFVATPVPEPESYGMLLAGLGLMGAFARRKNKSA